MNVPDDLVKKVRGAATHNANKQKAPVAILWTGL